MNNCRERITRKRKKEKRKIKKKLKTPDFWNKTG